MASFPLLGKKELYIGDEVIDSQFIQDELGSITLTSQNIEVASQAGTVNIPTGAYEEMSAELNIIVPSVRFLGRLFPSLYKQASFQRAELMEDNGETGQVVFGASECAVTNAQDIRIHNVCDGTSSAQDITFPQATIAPNLDVTISIGDPFIVTLQVTLNQGSEGAVVFGEANLDKAQYFDKATGELADTPKSATSISSNPSTISVNVGADADVAFTLTPEDATDTLTVTSVDKTKATVANKTGNTYTVHGVAAGSTKIHATAGIASIDVNVTVSNASA